jgi:putative sugar O-methyltransferase
MNSSEFPDFERKIRPLLEELDEIVRNNPIKQRAPLHGVAGFWLGVIQEFSSVASWPTPDLLDIRQRTFIVNGDLEAYDPTLDPEAEATRLRTKDRTGSPPAQWLLSEPDAPHSPNRYGVLWQGRRINYNTLRMQTCVSDLCGLGVLTRIEAASRANIVEIGGGYGALCGHIASRLPNATYFVVDFPEMLSCAAAYLMASYPNLKVGLANPVLPANVEKYDVVLVPNLFSSVLSDVAVDLAINMQSFMEMTTEQLQHYLRLIANALTPSGCVYSSNIDRSPFNEELVGTISENLSGYFDLVPPASFYDAVFAKVNERWGNLNRRYLGVPKGDTRFNGRSIRFTPFETGAEVVSGTLRLEPAAPDGSLDRNAPPKVSLTPPTPERKSLLQRILRR